MKFVCENCGHEGVVDQHDYSVVVGLDEVVCSECQSRMVGHQIQDRKFCHPPCGVRPKAKPYAFAWDVTNHLKVLDRSHNVFMYYFLENVAYHVPEREYELWSPARKKANPKWKPFVPDAYFFKTEEDGVVRGSSLVVSGVSVEQLAEVADIEYDAGRAKPLINTSHDPVEIVDCVVKIKDRLRQSRIPQWLWHDIILRNMLERYEAPFYAKEVPLWTEQSITLKERNGTREAQFAPMTGHADIIGGDEERVFIWDYKPRESGEDRGYNWVYYAPQLIAYGVMLLERVPELADLIRDGVMKLELGIFNEAKLVTFDVDIVYDLIGFFGARVTGYPLIHPIRAR